MRSPRRLFFDAVAWAGVGRVLIAVGLVLLLNPLYVGALHLDDPGWNRYDAAEVRFENGSIEGEVLDVRDDDVACLNLDFRDCALERHVFATDGARVPDGALSNLGGGHHYVYWEGQFYRTATEERNGSTALTLSPVEQGVALEAASTPLAAASDVAKRAIRDGPVTTHEPLRSAGELVRDGERYYVVVREAGGGPGPGHRASAVRTGRLLEAGLMVLVGAVGLAAMLRSQRYRVER